MKHNLGNVIPELPSLDISVTKDFYSNKLGFKLSYEQKDFLILEREGASIYFRLCDNKVVAENSSCYIHVRNIDNLLEEYKTKGIVPKLPLENKPWGMREFYVIDPSGNLLKFGEKIAN